MRTFKPAAPAVLVNDRFFISSGILPKNFWLFIDVFQFMIPYLGSFSQPDLLTYFLPRLVGLLTSH